MSDRIFELVTSENAARHRDRAALLNGDGGGGTSGGMEPRIAILEADMKHVKEQLGKLADLPADMATLKERTSHLATKAEVISMGDALAGKVQRNMYIIGALIALLTLILKLVPLAA